MVLKGREYRRREKGPKYLNKDNTRVKVIMFLYSVGKSNQHNMIHAPNAGLKNQEWGALSNVLDKMVEDKLIEKHQSEDAKNVSMYSLLDKGKDFAKFVEDNISSEKPHPIFTLDAFYDVKYFGKVNS